MRTRCTFALAGALLLAPALAAANPVAPIVMRAAASRVAPAAETAKPRATVDAPALFAAASAVASAYEHARELEVPRFGPWLALAERDTPRPVELEFPIMPITVRGGPGIAVNGHF